LKNLILATLTIFFLSACQSKPEIIEKVTYVETPIPHLTTLNKVEFYEIEDYKDYNVTYWLINKVEFDLASDRIKKKQRSIDFYEKQNKAFNEKFATKPKVN